MMHALSIRLISIPLATFALLVSAPSSAQIFKCMDDGQVSYQQSPCSNSHGGEQIEKKRTAEQKMIDRQNQNAALVRQQVKQQSTNPENNQDSMRRTPVVGQARQPQQAPPRIDQELCTTRTRSLRIAGSKTYNNTNERVAAITAAEIAADQACGTTIAGSASSLESARQQRLAAEAAERASQRFITHCAGDYCYDEQGESYFSTGSSTFVTSSGRNCNLFAGRMQCH